MNNQLNTLINLILNWWKEHEFDVALYGANEYNLYDEEPEFVSLAKDLKDEEKLEENNG